jgi:hypothetical protein
MSGVLLQFVDVPDTRREMFVSGAVPPFEALRARAPGEIPPADSRRVDVALLDMNCGWPNLGHDLLLGAVESICLGMKEPLSRSGIGVRTVSCDVRLGHVVPEPGERFSLYIGTGGPGHLDPRRNDGVSAASQGVVEDPSWEAPLFRLFDAIAADGETALVAVCHTFGLLCRWSGAAHPVLRAAPRAGKISGVHENVLSDEAVVHPYFSRFAAELRDGRHFRVVENRLFDLISAGPDFPAGATPLGYEAGPSGAGDVLTMLELAGDVSGAMPRVLAVNHHPEGVGAERQRGALEAKLLRGEVSREWYEERVAILRESTADAETERQLRLTSRFTLLDPIRFHLERALRARLAERGRSDSFAAGQGLDEAPSSS